MGVPGRPGLSFGGTGGIDDQPPKQEEKAMMAVKSDSDASSSDELPTLAEVIERIGVGWAQVRACFLGGGVMLADGAELLLISSVTKNVAQEWDLTPYRRGAVVTIVFVGVLVGTLLSGPIGDSLGRRGLIVFSYWSIFAFSIMSSYSNGFWSLVLLRLFVGASFGIGQPAWFSLCSEITPTKFRIAMNVCSQALFSFGEVYSAMVIARDDPQMRNLHWRWLLRVGAIPSFLLAVLALFFLNQSPSYLALHGRNEEALAVLQSMRDSNGSGDFPVSFRLLRNVDTNESWSSTIRRQIQIVFGRRLLMSTIVVAYSFFVLNMVFYGCLYAFPQILPSLRSFGQNPTSGLLEGALAELPGLALGFISGMWWPRKPVIKLYAFATSISLIAFALGVTLQSRVMYSTYSPKWTFFLLNAGYYGIKSMICIGLVAVYQYSSEIYPAEARVTGLAVNLAGGRLGGILAPMYFEIAKTSLGSDTFFFSIALLCIINIILVDLLPFETADKMLKDRASFSECSKANYGTAEEEASPL